MREQSHWVGVWQLDKVNPPWWVTTVKIQGGTIIGHRIIESSRDRYYSNKLILMCKNTESVYRKAQELQVFRLS